MKTPITNKAANDHKAQTSNAAVSEIRFYKNKLFTSGMNKRVNELVKTGIPVAEAAAWVKESVNQNRRLGNPPAYFDYRKFLEPAMGLPEPQDIRTPVDLKDPEITKEYPEVKVISGLLNTTKHHLEMIAHWRLACACAVEMLMPDANEREQREMIDKAAQAASKLLDEKPREAQQLSPASVTYQAKTQEDATYEIKEFSKRQNENAAKHNRDQLALQIYIAYRGSSEPHTYLIDAKSAYEAADAFIAERLKQNGR